MKARVTIFAILISSHPAGLLAAQPGPRTVAAFQNYVRKAEARIKQEEASPRTFLTFHSHPVNESPELQARLRQGGVMVESHGASPYEIPAGLVHDWNALVFIPNASLEQVLQVVRDYNHLNRYYAPAVVKSQLLSRGKQGSQISLRLRGKGILTVVFDAECEVRYGRLDSSHEYSFSRSTSVVEIADAGQRDEHPLSPADSHGFLWRLNTYWRFEEAAGGVIVQCEAISLTRDIPAGLEWLLGPILERIPRQSLQFTLAATRNAVLGIEKGEGHPPVSEARAPGRFPFPLVRQRYGRFF